MTWECPECHVSFSEPKTHVCPLPRATFSFGEPERPKPDHPDVIANRYLKETVRKVQATLEPVQTRVRVRGADFLLNRILNDLKQLEVICGDSYD